MGFSRQSRSDECGAQSLAVVELRNVSKSYVRGNSTNCVVDRVDLSVEKGQFVFLVGPSGSGKSTLLSIIGCVLSADSGDVRIMGQDVRGLNRMEAAELRLRHIGFVFQRFHLIRGLTAAENVVVPLTLAGWKTEDALGRAHDLLAAVGLDEHAHKKTHQLSVGQCQRVAFARALATDPDLILADEPTASLDAQSGRQALELLRRLALSAGKTVIVVTHDPRILEFADRVLHVENGRLKERNANDVAADASRPFELPELVGLR